ncbi:MAG: hypothetical protein CMI96_04545 [Pelagibacteraceae bacterium]|nr:hypothetical protein [Pelagibacteraceae bacterium]|tara:strand:+ start:7448 stop:8290 length:843 start_codon:yes stop_codon:yes gene_type:complete
MIKNIFVLIRIKDWIKNFIIFFPFLFSGNLGNISAFGDLLLVFIKFALASSIIYIFNDIVDVENDRNHKTKINKKPIASNLVSLNLAYILISSLLLILILILFNNTLILSHIILYILLNFFYSAILKKIAYVDLLCISAGYLIRLDAGSEAINVNTSLLLASTVFSLSLYIILIKRYSEYIYQSNMRNVYKHYSKKILKFLITISGVIFLICCFVFIIIQKFFLIIIYPFLIYLIFRYYSSSQKLTLGEYPVDLIFKDKILFLLSSLILIFTILVYYLEL